MTTLNGLGQSIPSVGATGGSPSLSGLESGINTAQVVSELMSVAAQPQQLLQGEQQSDQTKVTAYQALNTALQSVSTDAELLSLPSDWQAMAASSSDSTVATATATSGAVGGAFTFTVNNLATSASLISSASVASTATAVTSGNLLLSEAGGLGFSALAGDQTLATGAHTLTVTTATGGATLTGTTAVGASTTVTTGTNDTLAYTLDGAAKTLTIAAGTYSATQLAAAVASASNGDFTTSLNGNGQLQLVTTAQGSAHSATVTGGDALTSLGLTGGTTGTGTDGAVSLDGGASVAVSDAHAGAQLTLTSATGGTVTATLAGGLSAGSTTLQNVSTGGGSLAEVVNAVNTAGAGMSATAVSTGNGYRLQLTSSTTGAAAAPTLASNTFTGSLGSLVWLQAGQDATITVGSGANAYQVTSATNQLTGTLPGVSLDLVKASATPVTVTVAPDAASMATKVQTLVTDINSVITQAQSATAFTANNAALTGPLLGDSTVEGLLSGLTEALTGGVPGAALGDASSIGITVNSNGTLAFDSTKFTAAMASNPQGVEDLFQRTAGNGIAQQAKTFADAMSDPVKGAITAEIQGTQADMTSLTTQINAWTPILTAEQQQLTQEFTQMETALSQLAAQKAALGL
jgi:flagellar hook-associated protein 2